MLTDGTLLMDPRYTLPTQAVDMSGGGIYGFPAVAPASSMGIWGRRGALRAVTCGVPPDRPTCSASDRAARLASYFEGDGGEERAHECWEYISNVEVGEEVARLRRQKQKADTGRRARQEPLEEGEIRDDADGGEEQSSPDVSRE
eukprot:jgi/Mesvir1/22279/Mv17038-RA.1